MLKERDKMLGTILAQIGPQDASEVLPFQQHDTLLLSALWVSRLNQSLYYESIWWYAPHNLLHSNMVSHGLLQVTLTRTHIFYFSLAQG